MHSTRDSPYGLSLVLCMGYGVYGIYMHSPIWAMHVLRVHGQREQGISSSRHMTMPRARYTNPMTLALHVQKEYEATSIQLPTATPYYSAMEPPGWYMVISL